MDLFEEFKIRNNLKEIKKRNMEYSNVGYGVDVSNPDRVRPINMIGNGVSDYGSIIQTGGLQYCEELYHRCDIVKKSIDELIDETLRMGLIVEPKFKKKCKYCGEYLNRDERQCKCGNNEFIYPSKGEKELIDEFIDNINMNSQDLPELLSNIDFNLNVFDSAYLIARKEYIIDKNTKKIVSTKVKEIMSGGVYRLSTIMSADGRLGMNATGTKYMMVCPKHRNHFIEVDLDKVDNTFCNECGTQMLRAFARYDTQGSVIYYLDGEVKYFKKFQKGVGYGFPPILTLSTKINILLAQENFIQTAYSSQRPPRGILLIKANRESVARAWQQMKDLTKHDPTGLKPFVIDDHSTLSDAKNLVEFHDLSFKMDEVQLTEFRESLRRHIAMFWGVSPIFQGDMSTGHGLNNEGAQVPVANRQVEREQKILNRVLREILNFYGIKDWVIRVAPSKEIDTMALKSRNREELEQARMMMELGKKIEIRKENGEIIAEIVGDVVDKNGEMFDSGGKPMDMLSSIMGSDDAR